MMRCPANKIDNRVYKLEKVIQAVKKVLEKTPPELCADILDHGIAMTEIASDIFVPSELVC